MELFEIEMNGMIPYSNVKRVTCIYMHLAIQGKNKHTEVKQLTNIFRGETSKRMIQQCALSPLRYKENNMRQLKFIT